MKILEVVRGIPTDKNFLLGIFELEQAKSLASLGHEVIVLSLDFRSLRWKRKYGLSKFFLDNVLIYNFNFPLGRIPDSIFAFISTYFAKMVYRIIETENGRVDIIHAHFCAFQGYCAARLKSVYKLPLVITEHSSELLKNYKESRTKYFSYGYKNADCVISVSKALQKTIKNRFNIDSKVVFNIVDIHNFSYQKKESHNTFNFFSVANLCNSKGMDVLIHAFANLNKENVRLHIIGDGCCYNDLKSEVEKANLFEKVKFWGALPHKDISELYRKADAFVLASRFETFGVVYIEALASGLPVIATRCGGPEDIVTEDNGILVDVDDIGALTIAMEKMIAEYKTYNFLEIANTAKEKYAPQTIGRQLENVFKIILNKI